MPPEQRVEGRGVDGRAVDPVVETSKVPLATLIEGNPTELLTHEVPHRGIGQHAPEEVG